MITRRFTTSTTPMTTLHLKTILQSANSLNKDNQNFNLNCIKVQTSDILIVYIVKRLIVHIVAGSTMSNLT